MVVIVAAAAHKAVLVEILELRGRMPVKFGRDPDKVAHPLLALDSLEAGCVQVDEAFVTEDQRGSAPGSEGSAVPDVRPQSTRAICNSVTPSLFQPHPTRNGTTQKAYEIVKRYLLTGALLHDREGAAVVLRVVSVPGPSRYFAGDPVANQRVALDFVEAVAHLAKADHELLRRTPVIA